MKKVVLLMSVVVFVPLTKLFALTVEEENQKIRNFLELTDESGMKNGDKVCDWGYSPDDMDTWGNISRNKQGFVTDINWVTVWWDKSSRDKNIEINGPKMGDLISGDLDLSGFEYLRNISCEFNCLNYMNLSNCKSLEYINAWNGEVLSSINLEGCYNLVYLDVHRCRLTKINLSDCYNLESINIAFNNMNDEIDFTRCVRLKTLICSGNEINSLKISECKGLETLDCSLNNLSTIYLDACKNLLNINLSQNKFNQMNVLEFPVLETINCDHNKVGNINISMCPKLKELSCRYCGLSFIDVSLIPSLQKLDCSGNKIQELDLSKNFNFSGLDCTNNNLYHLDLTNNQKMHHLDCSSNPLSEIKAYLYKNYMRLSVNDVEMGYVAHISSGGGWLNPFRRHIRAIAKEGYVFCGWYSNNVLFSLKNEVEVNNDGFSGDLVAVFRSVDDVDKINIEDVIITTLNGNVFIKSGQEFLGGMVSIYDLSGMKIKSLQMDVEEFNLSINKQGVYIVCLEHEDKRISKKVVVN